MLNNDYLRGYVEALNNVRAFLETTFSYATDSREKETLEKTLNFIFEVKENYKQLVKDLNEDQSKKTT